MAHRARRRFQLIKPSLRGGSAPALRGRGLGAWYDVFLGVPVPDAVACSDPNYFSSHGECGSFWATAADAQAASGCTAMDATQMQAKIDDLKANWNPTGIYSPSDLNAIVNRVMTMVNAHHNAVMTYQQNYNTNYLDNVGDQFIAIGQQAENYIQATTAQTAQGAANLATNTPVSAPGLKDWVINAMTAMVSGMNALAIAACGQPWWFGSLATFQSGFDAVWGAAKSLAGMALAAGQTVVHALEAGVGFTAWLIKWAPLLVGGAIVVGGGLLFYRWNKTSHAFPSLVPSGVS